MTEFKDVLKAATYYIQLLEERQISYDVDTVIANLMMYHQAYESYPNSDDMEKVVDLIAVGKAEEIADQAIDTDRGELHWWWYHE